MARLFNRQTIEILKLLKDASPLPVREVYLKLKASKSYKEFYNIVFRLDDLELLKKKYIEGKLSVEITKEGEKLLRRINPAKDNIWKFVVFDIPEKHKRVRTILRAKLKVLGFKKWQNSIWASPYALDPEIEGELNELGKKFFVRLIRISSINHEGELEKMF